MRLNAHIVMKETYNRYVGRVYQTPKEVVEKVFLKKSDAQAFIDSKAKHPLTANRRIISKFMEG